MPILLGEGEPDLNDLLGGTRSADPLGSFSRMAGANIGARGKVGRREAVGAGVRTGGGSGGGGGGSGGGFIPPGRPPPPIRER